MIFKTSHSKVTHIIGKTLERGDRKRAYRKIIIGEVLPIDCDEEGTVANAKGNLKELATHKGELTLGFLIVAGKTVVLSLITTRHGRLVEIDMKLKHHSSCIIALETDGELRCGRTFSNAFHGHNGARFVAPWNIALKCDTIDAHETSGKDQWEKHAVMELCDFLKVSIGSHKINLLGKLDKLERSIELIIHIDFKATLQDGNAKGETLSWHQWILGPITLPVL